MNVDTLVSRTQFTSSAFERERDLLPLLNELTVHHSINCSQYDKIRQFAGLPNPVSSGFGAIPYLPVRAFKELDLVSVPRDEIVKTLTSSGTTGSLVSRIHLDASDATRQQFALNSVMQSSIGRERLPMLIIDSKSVLNNRLQYSARTAGVLGMMSFGRKHAWALDDNLNLDLKNVQEFLEEFGDERFLLFGFTFLTWMNFLEQLSGVNLDLRNGVLVHSGGWKKLIDRSVDNATFRREWESRTGLKEIYNFYGMVEQIGSVFVEDEFGWLRVPDFANVLIRDPRDWSIAESGTPGVIQVLSALPHSYPGHSLLTEDIGVMPRADEAPDETPRVRVLGRMSRSELRGCSDTISV